MPNVKKMIESAKDSVRKQSRNQSQILRGRTLHINNYSSSYKEVGRQCIQNNKQFERSTRIVEKQHQTDQPKLKRIGLDLDVMDAQKALLSNMDKLHNKCSIKSSSQYYDHLTGKNYKMSQLKDLRFDNQPQKFESSFNNTINDRDEKFFVHSYIKEKYDKASTNGINSKAGQGDDFINPIKANYRQYNDENKEILKDYLLP